MLASYRIVKLLNGRPTGPAGGALQPNIGSHESFIWLTRRRRPFYPPPLAFSIFNLNLFWWNILEPSSVMFTTIHVFFIIGTNDMDNNAKNVNGVIVKYILCFKIIDAANINLLAQEP